MVKEIVVEAIPLMDDAFKNKFSNKKIDKNAAIFGICIALSFLAIAGYYINISLIKNISTVITIAACGYSIYNLNKVIKK